jgi:hypothetical protein
MLNYSLIAIVADVISDIQSDDVAYTTKINTTTRQTERNTTFEVPKIMPPAIP